MRWTLTIGAPFGIPIRIHWSFLLLVAWALAIGLGGDSAALTLLLLTTVFGSVILHELGHSVAAMRFGIKVEDITLWPLGGMARMQRFPDDPKQQLVIAIAGPIVSFALAGAFFGLTWLFVPTMTPNSVGGHLLLYTAQINLLLGAFNLLPALPMDGGRILRAVLAMTSLRDRATRIAARVGQVFAVAMATAGVMIGHFWLVLIAIFVFFAAERESVVDRVTSRFSRTTAWQAMLKPVATAARMTSIGSLADYAATHEQQDFPIIEGKSVVGLATRWDIVQALVNGLREEPVFTIMNRDVTTVTPWDTLDKVLRTGLPLDRAVLPVVQDERVVGLVTPERLQKSLA
ncbi:site-2 protease family protein [bacterium]|nr:site-2 protease family protein [bacterium]